MPETIFKRTITDNIIPYLVSREAVVLHGARQVGKTSLMYFLRDILKTQHRSTHFLDLEDSRFVRILDAGVEAFFTYLREENLMPTQGEKLFLFIDEIQYLQNPSEFLKLVVDHHPELKLIVSGSSSFDIKSKFKDSLVGRTVNFEIFNLSFQEFLVFRGVVAPLSLPLTLKKQEELLALYTEYVLYGGYPKIVLTEEIAKKETYLQQIIDTYVRKDIRDIGAIKNIEKFNLLLLALSAQSGQLMNVSELANTLGLAKQTIEEYLFLLEQTYIVRRVRPFYRNIRSELSKTPKLFFYDTGLLHMLWLKQLPKEIIGQAFETSVFAELTKKYGKDSIRYWRTIQGQEIDFILQPGVVPRPFEVKLNFSQAGMAVGEKFSKKYQSAPVRVVGLRGEKIVAGIYPWEI